MYEYKVVPAPSRAVKVKGLKTTAERFAHALAERINAEAAGGWHFVRSEAMPCEERTRLGGTRQSQQVVMIFAREIGARRPDAAAALAAAQSGGKGEGQTGGRAPLRLATVDEVEESVGEAPEPAAPATPARRQEPLFRSGAMLRSENAGRVEPVLRPRQTAGEGDEE